MSSTISSVPDTKEYMKYMMKLYHFLYNKSIVFDNIESDYENTRNIFLADIKLKKELQPYWVFLNKRYNKSSYIVTSSIDSSVISEDLKKAFLSLSEYPDNIKNSYFLSFAYLPITIKPGNDLVRDLGGLLAKSVPVIPPNTELDDLIGEDSDDGADPGTLSAEPKKVKMGAGGGRFDGFNSNISDDNLYKNYMKYKEKYLNLKYN